MKKFKNLDEQEKMYCSKCLKIVRNGNTPIETEKVKDSSALKIDNLKISPTKSIKSNLLNKFKRLEKENENKEARNKKFETESNDLNSFDKSMIIEIENDNKKENKLSMGNSSEKIDLIKNNGLQVMFFCQKNTTKFKLNLISILLNNFIRMKLKHQTIEILALQLRVKKEKKKKKDLKKRKKFKGNMNYSLM